MRFKTSAVCLKSFKVNKYRKSVISVVLLLSFALLSSCGVVHREFPLHYSPAPNSSSLSSNPVNIFIEIIDNRILPEKEMIGKYGRVIFVVQNGAVATVEAALKKALEGNGYHIVSSSDQGAQFKLKLSLTRLWVEDTSTGGGWAINTKAEIQADVEVSKTNQEMRAAKFVVNVDNSHLVVIVGRWGIYDTLHPAFDEFIQKVATHPELISFINGDRRS